MRKIRLILPTYNERENIKKLIPRIFKIAKKSKLDIDILVIDDNSPDKTSEAVEELGKKYPVKIIKRDFKGGLGSAYIEGFNNSINEDKEVIFEMDSDLSHDPEYIPKFIKEIDKGFDLVIGERKKTIGWGLYRKAISFGGNFIGRNIAGIKIKDLTTGYRAYKINVLKSLDLENIKSNGYAFQLEIIIKTLSRGFKIGSIPIIFYDRKNGKSKLSKKDMIEFMILSLRFRIKRLFSDRYKFT